MRTAAQRLATSTVSSVAQRLIDIGVRVRMLSSQAEARAIIDEEIALRISANTVSNNESTGKRKK